jgi:hypothetical protein
MLGKLDTCLESRHLIMHFWRSMKRSMKQHSPTSDADDCADAIISTLATVLPPWKKRSHYGTVQEQRILFCPIYCDYIPIATYSSLPSCYVPRLLCLH